MAKNKDKKKKRYVRLRHRIYIGILKVLAYLIIKFKYHFKFEKIKDKRAYLVLFNHQTSADQFFIYYMFPRPLYFIATEDLFSTGFLAKILVHIAAPIPFKKSTNDVRATMQCMKIAKEGGSIALSPEGNRTYSGKTVYIKPAIAKFAKALGMPIALVHIHGGFGAKPRFSDVIRKGPINLYFHKIIEKEEYDKMSNEEFLDVITKGLYVDESYSEYEYKSKKHAEYLERVIYVCPKCGLSEFYSKNDTITCKHCGYETIYNGHNQFDDRSKFKSVSEWYEYQENYISSLKLSDFQDIIYMDKVLLQKVILYKKKEKIDKNAEIYLYNNRYVIKTKDKEYEWLFDDISTVSVLGKNKCNIYIGDDLYQIKGNKRFNPLKYMNIYYHYKNLMSGEEITSARREFLGL